jgi:type IV pilus assembly protein PilB
MEAAAQQPWPALGSLLVRDGLLTEQELESALALQRESGKRLGEILIERGDVTRTQLARLLAEQVEMPLVELEESEVDTEAALLLPEDLARRYRALPVGFLADESLLVAVADPTNVLHWDELRLALGVPIRFGVAAPDAIDAAIAYVHQETLDVVEPEEEQKDEAGIAAGIVDMHDAEVDTPAVALVNKTIQRALALGASDIHFTPQLRALEIRARVDGVVRKIGSVPTSQQAAVTSRLKVIGRLDIAERRAPQDGRVAVRTGGHTIDLRIAILPTKFGEKVTLRVLNQASAPRSLSDLALAPSDEETIRRAIHQPFGAVITCGPTGSGKTTTLYAALNELNTPERTLMSIEDPVEYLTPGVDQIEVNPRAGLTFARGLRTILRSDPDVILVGEIRDEETAQIAIRAAMTGHLVCSTIHSQTAASAIRRLTDMGLEPGLLAATLTCLVAQRLARRVCLDCRESYRATKEELVSLGRPSARPGRVELMRGRGCPACGGTGYRGRVALFEVLMLDDDLRELIAGGATTMEVHRAAVAAGMRPLRADGIRLSLEGVTTIAEVNRVVGDQT